MRCSDAAIPKSPTKGLAWYPRQWLSKSSNRRHLFHLFFGDVVLLRIDESQNFITLDAAHRQVAHDAVVVLSTGATHLLQESQDRDLGYG